MTRLSEQVQRMRTRIAGWHARRPLQASLVAFLLGLVIGWFVLGWWLLPVAWTNALPGDLNADWQRVFVQLVADAYAVNQDAPAAHTQLDNFDNKQLSRILGDLTTNPANAVRRGKLRSAPDQKKHENAEWQQATDPFRVRIYRAAGGINAHEQILDKPGEARVRCRVEGHADSGNDENRPMGPCVQ